MGEDVGEIPPGWFVMHCSACKASLAWLEGDLVGRDIVYMNEDLEWAASNVDHDIELHKEYDAKNTS